MFCGLKVGIGLNCVLKGKHAIDNRLYAVRRDKMACVAVHLSITAIDPEHVQIALVDARKLKRLFVTGQAANQ